MTCGGGEHATSLWLGIFSQPLGTLSQLICTARGAMVVFMLTRSPLATLPIALLSAACLGAPGGGDVGDGTDTDGTDGTDGTDDGGGGGGGAYPTWQLQDIQPDSPRYGDTYGLNVFEGKPLVVALLLGY
jgi:hypothetical protein